MTNHHASRGLSGVAETLLLWRDRLRARRELARWSERDIHDAGFSELDVMAEVAKPFWRA